MVTVEVAPLIGLDYGHLRSQRWRTEARWCVNRQNGAHTYTQKPQDYKPVHPYSRTVPGLGIPTVNETTPLSCMVKHYLNRTGYRLPQRLDYPSAREKRTRAGQDPR